MATTKTVKIDEDKYEKLRQIRKESGVTISEQIRRLIIKHIKEWEEKQS